MRQEFVLFPPIQKIILDYTWQFSQVAKLDCTLGGIIRHSNLDSLMHSSFNLIDDLLNVGAPF